jgi:predicted metal-dependent HD superfamily phosphohydrolase
MARLGVGPSPQTYDALIAAYAEPHRHYHNAGHIDACLTLLDEYAHLARSAVEVETALWFHDAVYKLLAARNEEESAEWCTTFLHEEGVDEARTSRIHVFILATKHNARPETDDAALIVDIDLAILGREPAHYQQFETAIRQEYHAVPQFLYRRKRRDILQAFLDRENIYAHPLLHERFEAQARTNLRAAIAALA